MAIKKFQPGDEITLGGSTQTAICTVVLMLTESDESGADTLVKYPNLNGEWYYVMINSEKYEKVPPKKFEVGRRYKLPSNSSSFEVIGTSADGEVIGWQYLGNTQHAWTTKQANRNIYTEIR